MTHGSLPRIAGPIRVEDEDAEIKQEKGLA